MVKKLCLSVIIVAVLTAGCALPQKKAKLINIDKPGTSAITYPTELRAAYFMTRNDTVQYCAEPAPDVALDTLQRLAAEVSAKIPAEADISGEFDAELATKVVQLAGRTELILLAREMLYRACEFTLNYPDPESAKKALSMYMRVATLVETLGQADRARAEAELLKVSFGPDKSSNCIREWLNKDSHNVDILNAWLKEKAGGISIAMFIHGRNYSVNRSEFIKSQEIPCD